MRPPREVVILLVLLIVAMAAVLGYVVYRRRHPSPSFATQAVPPPAPTAPAPEAAGPKPPAGSTTVPARPADPTLASPVDLAQHDRQTIDFSGGKPVVRQSAKDRAALEAGARDIDEATKDVTFGPSDSAAAPPPPPAPKH